MKVLLGKSKTLRTTFKTPPYEVFIFAVLFLEFLCYVPSISWLNFWNSIYYVLTYDAFDFNSRLILGSIINIFTKYISTKTVYLLINIFTILFIIFVSAVIGKLARNISKNTGTDAEIFIILFCACPVSIFYLFNFNNFGRLDLFLIFITVVSLCCANNRKLKWIVPALCFLAMAFNQNFVIMYMPVVGIVLLYEFLTGNNSKTRLFIFVISCLTVIISFIYFKFLAPTPDFNSLAEIKAFLAERTNIKNGEIVVGYEFYINYFSYYTKDFGYSWVKDVLSTYGICILTAIAPLLVIFVSFWKIIIQIVQEKKIKFIFLLCLLAPVGGFPMFIATDWDRWIPTLFLSQFMLAFYFIAVNDAYAVNSVKILKSFFSRHYLLFLFIVIYSASLIFSRLNDVLWQSLSKLDYFRIVENFFPK
ncbi:MAG: hypothetical protein WCN92_04030 [Eubacteriales bacterium]